jgi:hypothetical protein
MDAYARVDEIVPLGDFDGAVKRAGTVTGPNAKNICSSCVSSSSDDLLAVRLESRTIEVAVGIDVHKCLGELGTPAPLGAESEIRCISDEGTAPH